MTSQVGSLSPVAPLSKTDHTAYCSVTHAPGLADLFS